MAHRPLRILMVSAEVESLARTGGLGDVVEALSACVAELETHVLLVTPLYGVTRVPKGTTRWSGTVGVRVGWAPGDVRHVGVVELAPLHGGFLRVCLIDDPALFARNGIYGDAFGTFGDNELRFATLSRAALEISSRAWGEPTTTGDGGPDVIHAHDWHAALAIIYAKTTMGEAWNAKKSCFTIHNLGFQGVLAESALDELAIPRALFAAGTLAHQGNVNLMKGAISLAGRITAVSPTYASEILTPEAGMGLDAHLRSHAARLVGVLNGIDMARFDPSNDASLPFRYDPGTAMVGKRECRRAIHAECELDGDVDAPLFSTVSRLTWQKGMDLLLEVVPALVAKNARVLLVGQGDAALEDAFRNIAGRFPGRVAVRVAFDPDLARRVYAASDFFVVPSRYEPCGLTQMYAMRYGAVPIVTAVGGLRDTVTAIDAQNLGIRRGTGVIAAHPTAESLSLACDQAMALHRNRAALEGAVHRGMSRDSSWTPSAKAYLEIYRELVEGR